MVQGAWQAPGAPPVCAPGSAGAWLGARVVLTQDVALAERAGLLQQEPGIHTVPVELMGAGQHPQPLPAGKWAHMSTAGCQQGHSPDAGRDTLALASDWRLSLGWAPVHPVPPGSCGTGPGRQHSCRSHRPVSEAASRDGTAGFSVPTAAAGCAASGPAVGAQPRVRAHPTAPSTAHSKDTPTFPPRHPAPTGPAATGAGPAP